MTSISYPEPALPLFRGLDNEAVPTELNNALRMFVTSLLSSTLVPRAAILTVSATDRSSGLWNVNELLNESVSCLLCSKRTINCGIFCS